MSYSPMDRWIEIADGRQVCQTALSECNAQLRNRPVRPRDNPRGYFSPGLALPARYLLFLRNVRGMCAGTKAAASGATMTLS
jgi:hypothetical protein